MGATGDKLKTLSWRRVGVHTMNREEAARVLSSMRDTLKKVYLVAIDEERISALEAAVGFLLAEDNNVPVKQPDPITGLVPCGCGCNPELRAEDWGWYQVYCTGCDMHGGNSQTPDNVIEEWNEAMGYKGGAG